MKKLEPGVSQKCGALSPSALSYCGPIWSTVSRPGAPSTRKMPIIGASPEEAYEEDKNKVFQ